MPNELVSIIMPAYNSDKTIYESITSAVAQSYKNIELIIVDDGSIDKTAYICKNYAENDPRVRYYAQKNSGVASARNTGIKMSKGEFIAFLDADDLWEKEKIELQMAASRNHPEYIILTGLQRFSQNGVSRTTFSITLPPKYDNTHDYLPKLLNLRNHEMTSFATALVPKGHLEAVGLFDENLVTAEDWDLWIRLAYRFSFTNIDRPLVFYRKYAGSLTKRTKLRRTLHGQLYIIDKMKRTKILLPSEIRAARMRKYLEFAEIYRYQRVWLYAILLTGEAIFSCPGGFNELLWKAIFRKSGRIPRKTK